MIGNSARGQVHGQRGTSNFGPGSGAKCAKKITQAFDRGGFLWFFLFHKRKNMEWLFYRLKVQIRCCSENVLLPCPSLETCAELSRSRVDSSGLASRRVRTVKRSLVCNHHLRP